MPTTVEYNSNKISLRETDDPNFNVLGRALTYAEEDNNMILIFYALQTLRGRGEVSVYDTGLAYTNTKTQIVIFNNGVYFGLYLCISPAIAGQSPTTNSSLWQEIGPHSPSGSTINITAHSGGGQGSATPLTTRYNKMSVILANGDSTLLLTAKVSKKMYVYNPFSTGHSVKVFPQVGEYINDQKNLGVFVLAGNLGIFEGVDTGRWFFTTSIITSGS